MKDFTENLNNEEGQTVVEYILLMFVMITIIISGMGQIQDWFLANAENCTENSKSFICKMDQTFTGQFNSYTSMRYYILRR